MNTSKPTAHHLRMHWDGVYAARSDTALTWHQDTPRPALDVIVEYATPGAPIIDVGGGTSRLVDALLARGLGPVTVLDISQQALTAAQDRLGKHAARVRWVSADITRWEPAMRYALWHDRAVFHFLTDADDRTAYLQRLDAALTDDGIAVLSTFADDGPESCSGLPVVRYSPEALAATLAHHLPGRLHLVAARRHDHLTPKGNVQKFQTSVLGRGRA